MCIEVISKAMTALELMKPPNKIAVYLGRRVRFSTPNTSYWSTTRLPSLNA